MKKCSKCKEVLDNSMFYKNHRNCKKCHKKNVSNWQSNNKEKILSDGRVYNIKKRYGITQSDYDKMFIEQDGKCAICGSSEIKRTNSKHFCIDHCHSTNKVRGLLCHDCNVILGKLNDNIDMCNSIIKYLQKSF
jgi:hypothetical protein